MAQAQGHTGVTIPKISYASTMIVEDHLKKLLTSNTEKPFKCSNNKLLPRPQHSPFGDFPADKMPPKKATVTQPPAIEKHELSVSAKGISNLTFLTVCSNPEEGRGPGREASKPEQAEGEASPSEASRGRLQHEGRSFI